MKDPEKFSVMIEYEGILRIAREAVESAFEHVQSSSGRFIDPGSFEDVLGTTDEAAHSIARRVASRVCASMESQMKKHVERQLRRTTLYGPNDQRIMLN